MKYYRLITSNKEGSFSVAEDELPKLIEAIKNGRVAAFREGVLLNVNMAVSIVPDKERAELVFEAEKYGSKFEQPSPFAKLLAGEMKMLSDKSRTEAQEEAARGERN